MSKMNETSKVEGATQTNVTSKAKNMKPVRPKLTKAQWDLKHSIQRIEVKFYKGEKLNKLDIKLIKYYIGMFIPEKNILNPSLIKIRRTWDIKVYQTLVDFKETMSNQPSNNYNDYDTIVYVFQAVLKLRRVLDKEIENEFQYLAEDVAAYYRECFMGGKTVRLKDTKGKILREEPVKLQGYFAKKEKKKNRKTIKTKNMDGKIVKQKGKILTEKRLITKFNYFSSNKFKIVINFKKNTIKLKDLVNKRTYTRDILIDELDIFPNAILKHQFMGN